MQKNIVEILLGALVLIIAGVFFVFAYKSSNLRPVQGYDITADFTRIDGLKVGNDVKISGVKVGSVISQNLNSDNYLATITLSIDPKIKLPVDTIASINSESLFGGKYVSLEPGADETFIAPKGKIEYTQSTPGLEQLLGQVIFNMQSKGNDKDEAKQDNNSNPPKN